MDLGGDEGYAMKRLATVLVAVAALLGAGLTAPADAGNPSLGRLWTHDKVLRKGCHDYRYAYQVTSRAEEWALETFLRDPTGEIIASNAKDSMVDAKRGTGRSGSAATAPSPAGSRSGAS